MAINVSAASRHISNVSDLRQHVRTRVAELQRLSGDPTATRGEVNDGLFHATYYRDPEHPNHNIQYRVALMNAEGGLQQLEVGSHRLEMDCPPSCHLTAYEALPPGKLTSAAHRFLGGGGGRAPAVLTDFLARHQRPFQRTAYSNCLDGTLETKLIIRTGTVFDPPDEFGNLTQNPIALSTTA